MSDLINRLRSYLPLGDGSLWSQSSKDYAIAADALEAQAKEIAELDCKYKKLYILRGKDMELIYAKKAEIKKLKALCDQLGSALDEHCAPFLRHEEEHRLALEAWRASK